ncbi:acetyl-CoA synthetase-like protein [Stipitochalara longipes BDJ]|nr:acetyl-CoA synthetase-like protein [Stipitochalara longipes BDJ]
MAPEAPSTYFTCTLGQAAEQNRGVTRDFETVTQFIDHQARVHPDNPAVAFPLPTSEKKSEWGCNILSFRDLRRGSVGVVNSLKELVVEDDLAGRQPCVALICPSSEDFLFAWLGLMRAGFAVLLIAPQCQPEAIAHLCKSCEVSTLFYDQVYRDLALSATKVSSDSLVAHNVPWQQSNTSLNWIIKNTPPNLNHTPVHISISKSIAYIHHTSGTSTGLPKPIPQTHHAAVGVLPQLAGSTAATFTTTPLYHGGIADCFRAWTSNALIWLFPGTMPITTRNILLSLTTAQHQATEDPERIPRVKYFSSVPYVLQMLSEDTDGVFWLQKMDIVGVGGAALPESVGNSLTSMGVNLISRFGSAECGFLLSSHRNYAKDKAWQYLRVPSSSPYLRFEEQEDGSGLSELVVLEGWPHMAKTNREDGSFATSDLFEPHHEIEGAWRYHSRNDSQITLITGKKFDPAPVEDAITAAAGEVRDCFVFGNGRQVPGVLVFLKPDTEISVKQEAVEERIWRVIEEVNRKGQDHTRISRDMVVLKKEGKLEKSSKGTVLRGAAEKRFASDIEAAYAKEEPSTVPNSSSEGKGTKEIVREVVFGVLGTTELGDQDDFYQHGVDSASCMRIRNQLGKHFHVEGKSLPWNIVYDCGNIQRLSEFLASWQGGNVRDESGSEEMLELVDRYSDLNEPVTKQKIGTILASDSSIKGEIVMLTGATGALGSHVLSQLLANPTIIQVYCLVRHKATETAEDRVLSVLKQRFILPDSQASLGKVHCLPAHLQEQNLGLSISVYDKLQNEVSTIIHAAWPVNFSLPLRAFEPSLRGLNNLLRLSQSSSRFSNFIFCSSTAAVLGPNHPSVIPETISKSPDDADSLGYSKSKWAAEVICSRVAESLNKESKVKIIRIGQLTGDTEHGVWNMSEAYPLMLSTVMELGCLPRINDKLSWLPLDVAAKAVCDISLVQNEKSLEGDSGTACEVYHLVNNDTSTSFTDLLEWLKKVRKEPFEVIESRQWLEKLETLENHPGKALLALWKRAYGSDAEADAQQVTIFDTRNAEKASQRMKSVSSVDEELLGKIWKWLEGEMAKND